MGDVFLKLVNMSITASWMVLGIVVLRLVLKKAPRWLSCLLWGAVGLRLVLPFSFESVLSLIPSTETIRTTELVGRPFEVNVGVPVIDQTVGDYIGTHYYEGVTVPADTFWDATSIAALMWAIGVGVMLIYGVFSYIRLHKTVAVSLRERENIFVCDAIDSPFLFGIIKPRIYLPSALTEEQKRHVIAHEQAHLSRRDHWFKPLGFALLSVYWFNPVLWVAYILFCRDIEAACDEKVIAAMDTEAKKSYSEALVACSMHRRKIMVCPLAFGEVGVKARIRSVLHYKKPTVWILAVSLILCTVAGVCLLTDPPEENEQDSVVVSLEDAIAYYEDTLADKEYIWYNSKSAFCASLECPVSPQLMSVLHLEQWQETTVDEDVYMEQRVLSHSLGSKDGYALKLNIGKEYGGIEWYADVIDEVSEDGVTLSREELQGVLCFALPQDNAGELIGQLESLSWLYEIGKNTSVYIKNGDFEVIETTAQYQLLRESGGERCLFVPTDSEIAFGAYTGDVKVTADGKFLRIESAEGEHWYEPDSGWYWKNDLWCSVNPLYDRRDNYIIYSLSENIYVCDIVAKEDIAVVTMPEAYIAAGGECFIHKARFTDDHTIEVTYYADEARRLRTFTFEIEDTAKSDPLVDPPKTALKMPEKICLEDQGWSDAVLVITQEDAHSVRFASTENGVEVVTLSESNIRRLNRLYASVTDFSANDSVWIADGVEAMIQHDGVTDSFSIGAAASLELDYYIDQLCRLGAGLF